MTDAEIKRLRDMLAQLPQHGSGRAARIALDALPALLDEVERLKRACSMLNDEVSQTLGRALGYPKFCDDQKNFPGATDADGVCVGDHVAESLAAEASKEIERLRADAARYRWLRDVQDDDSPFPHGAPYVIRLDIEDTIEYLSGDALDAAIDAEMGEETTR